MVTFTLTTKETKTSKWEYFNSGSQCYRWAIRPSKFLNDFETSYYTLLIKRCPEYVKYP
jgi:hypothetical protein